MGAPRDSRVGHDSGSVQLFRRDLGQWTTLQTLYPENPIGTENFGTSVALQGDVLAVGSPFDNFFGQDSGSVSIYRFNGQLWTIEQRLSAPQAQAGARFGFRVALYENRLLIGAPNHQSGGGVGQAHVFRFDGQSWGLEQTLQTADAASHVSYGFAVDINRNRAIVGDPLRTFGTAHVFSFDGTGWTETKKLTSATSLVDHFGKAVVLCGDIVAIGAPLYNGSFGRVFLYRGDDVELEQIIDSVSGFWFGQGIEIHSDTMVVSHGNNSSRGGGSVFHYDGSRWNHRSRLELSEGRPPVHVALMGDLAILGDPRINSFRAYAARDRVSGVAEEIPLGYNMAFSRPSVSADRDRMAVGVARADVRVFERQQGTFVLDQVLTSIDASFGTAVALEGDELLIGAPAVAGHGWVYLLVFNGSRWVLTQNLIANDAQPGDGFGQSLYRRGQQVLIGSHSSSTNGAVYVFEKIGGVFQQTDKVIGPDSALGDEFGQSAAWSGDFMIVGSPDHDGIATDHGAVYFFRKESGSWRFFQKFEGPGMGANEFLGTAVDIRQGVAYGTAPRFDRPQVLNEGAAFQYEFDGTRWNHVRTLTPNSPRFDQFGVDLRIDNEQVAVLGLLGSIDLLGRAPLSPEWRVQID